MNLSGRRKQKYGEKNKQRNSCILYEEREKTSEVREGFGVENQQFSPSKRGAGDGRSETR
jgi:hypothetical protein